MKFAYRSLKTEYEYVKGEDLKSRVIGVYYSTTVAGLFDYAVENEDDAPKLNLRWRFGDIHIVPVSDEFHSRLLKVQAIQLKAPGAILCDLVTTPRQLVKGLDWSDEDFE